MPFKRQSQRFDGIFFFCSTTCVAVGFDRFVKEKKVKLHFADRRGTCLQKGKCVLIHTDIIIIYVFQVHAHVRYARIIASRGSMHRLGREYPHYNARWVKIQGAYPILPAN